MSTRLGRLHPTPACSPHSSASNLPFKTCFAFSNHVAGRSPLRNGDCGGGEEVKGGLPYNPG